MISHIISHTDQISFIFLATQLFKLLNKYRPETNIQKRKRLVEAAQAKKEKKDTAPSKAPAAVKYGINQVTTLVEQKQAKLVIIAHDVDPIEVWLLLWIR